MSKSEMMDDGTVKSADVLADLSWTYDAAADREPETGRKTADDGYSIWGYFDGLADEYPTRDAAVTAIKAGYKGPDVYGVGLDVETLS